MVALVLDGLVGFPAALSPTSFYLSPTSFHLSPTSFHLSPSSFHCLWCLWSRVCGWLVSHFLSFVSQFFSFVSQFFSFLVSQAGCLWSGSLVSHLSPTSFHLSPFLSFVGFPAGLSPTSFPTSFHLSPTSFHLSGWVLWLGLRLACLPRAFICLPLLSFVSQAGCLWSGSRLACLPLPFICLPVLFRWVFVVLACLPLPVICLPLLFICLPGNKLKEVGDKPATNPIFGLCVCDLPRKMCRQFPVSRVGFSS